MMKVEGGGAEHFIEDSREAMFKTLDDVSREEGELKSKR